MANTTKKTTSKATEKPVVEEAKKTTTKVENEKPVEPKEAKKEEKILNFDTSKTYLIVWKEMANKNCYGTTGTLIEFNDKGIAEVGYEEAKYFSPCSCCTIKEKE